MKTRIRNSVHHSSDRNPIVRHPLPPRSRLHEQETPYEEVGKRPRLRLVWSSVGSYVRKTWRVTAPAFPSRVEDTTSCTCASCCWLRGAE